MPNFTQEELVAYMYNETNTLLTHAIKTHSEKDSAIREELNSLLAVQENLDSLSYQPGQLVISRILRYAEKTSLICVN
jgi:hypothetical protein